MKYEKRVNKGYKCKDSVYQKALKKCKDTPLSTLIEQWVTTISKGGTVMSTSKWETVK